MSETVDLIVPEDKRHLLYLPEIVALLCPSSLMGARVYFPIGDKDGNWIYRLPVELAEKIASLGFGLEANN